MGRFDIALNTSFILAWKFFPAVQMISTISCLSCSLIIRPSHTRCRFMSLFLRSATFSWRSLILYAIKNEKKIGNTQTIKSEWPLNSPLMSFPPFFLSLYQHCPLPHAPVTADNITQPIQANLKNDDTYFISWRIIPCMEISSPRMHSTFLNLICPSPPHQLSSFDL